MLEGGEDPRFIARRMVILASEDIGNADPQALVVAVAAAVEHVGLPECTYALAQAAIRLSLAPKSDAAGRAAARGRARADPPRDGAPRAGRSARRRRLRQPARSHPGHTSPQELMPEGLEGVRFYAPDGAEARAGRRRSRAYAPPESARRGRAATARRGDGRRHAGSGRSSASPTAPATSSARPRP